MITYISLFNWTEQGIKDVKHAVESAANAAKLIEQAGGHLVCAYWTQGPYDLIAIAEWPDEETAMAMVLTVGASGTARSVTMRGFNVEEMTRILDKMP